jgi:hypothetical protein
MNVSFIERHDVTHLDSILLDSNGFCRVLPADEVNAINRDSFRLWCGQNAVYLYPTQELVEYLTDFIAGRNVIEVGAGNGHLGNALGIPMTDSGMQMRPEIIAQYQAMGQACTCPPAVVDIIDAVDAVAKYKPQVVVASWLTHKWEPGMSTGNMFGPDEREIIAMVDNYVHIGNDTTHWEKPVWDLPHNKAYHPWIVSRAIAPEQDHIAIWGKI